MDLNEKLNTWAGTADIDYTHPRFGIVYCIEELLPKLQHGLGITVIIYFGGGATVGYPVIELKKMSRRVVPLEMDSKNPALSLCLAIEKLIGSQDDK